MTLANEAADGDWGAGLDIDRWVNEKIENLFERVADFVRNKKVKIKFQ